MTSPLPWIASLALTLAGTAQAPRPETTVDWSQVENRIPWFGTLDGGLAAARATGRPIILVSAAPACREVPGVW